MGHQHQEALVAAFVPPQRYARPTDNVLCPLKVPCTEDKVAEKQTRLLHKLQDLDRNGIQT